MNFWLVKQEPSAYSWEQFVKDKGTYWNGVQNYQARNNLQAMKKDDLVLFYHSVVGKEIMGIAKVTKESYPDPTVEEGNWVVVDLKPVKAFNKTVTLEEIKNTAKLKDIALIKQSRLSVMPLKATEFKILLQMSGTPYPGI